MIVVSYMAAIYLRITVGGSLAGSIISIPSSVNVVAFLSTAISFSPMPNAFKVLVIASFMLPDLAAWDTAVWNSIPKACLAPTVHP